MRIESSLSGHVGVGCAADDSERRVAARKPRRRSAAAVAKREADFEQKRLRRKLFDVLPLVGAWARRNVAPSQAAGVLPAVPLVGAKRGSSLVAVDAMRNTGRRGVGDAAFAAAADAAAGADSVAMAADPVGGAALAASDGNAGVFTWFELVAGSGMLMDPSLLGAQLPHAMRHCAGDMGCVRTAAVTRVSHLVWWAASFSATTAKLSGQPISSGMADLLVVCRMGGHGRAGCGTSSEACM